MMNLIFPLQLLLDLKTKRNNDPNASLNSSVEISDPDKPGNKVRIIGNLTIGLVRGVPIGF